MIKLNNINISFNDRVVFNQASFEADFNQLTVISGKSGSGKSTLINFLIGRYPCDYYFMDERIEQENVNQHLYQNVGLVLQIPSFFEGLTINEQISFIKDMYDVDFELDEYIEMLGLKDSLNKYPKWLSGGERKRASILFSIIKRPAILILDEPTAMLDKENKQIVIDFLSMYAHSGHIVVVATHDSLLKKEADVIYSINNENLEKEVIKQGKTIEIKRNQLAGKIRYFKYIIKVQRHNKFYLKIMNLIIPFSISFMVISYSFNNAYMDYFKEKMKYVTTDEIIVYKGYFDDREYTYDGYDSPMTSDDYKTISKIEGVKDVQWRFDSTIDLDNDIYLTFDDVSDKNERITLKAYQNDNLINEIIKSEYNGVLQLSYSSNRSYSQCLKAEFNDDEDGVYISESFFLELFGNDFKNNNKEIEFMMNVPIYNTNGIGGTLNQDYVTIPTNYIIREYVKVKLKVNGVVADNESLGAETTEYKRIYVSQNTIKKYYDELSIKYPNQRMGYYIKSEDKNYMSNEPLEIELSKDDQVVTQEKWTPETCGALTIVLEDALYVDQVIKQLKDEGYNLQNEYFNLSNYIQMHNNSKVIYITVSVVILFVFLVFYIYIKYLQELQNKSSDEFLMTLGLNRNKRNRYFIGTWLYKTVISYILSLFFFSLIKSILEEYNIALIKFDGIVLVSLTMMIFIIEFVVPMILRKVIHYD